MGERLDEQDKRIAAQRDYISGMTYKNIAEKYDVSINTVKSWKTRHNWVREKGAHKTEKGAHKKRGAVKEIQEAKRVMTNPNLSEEEKLFCLYYWKSRNATQAYQKAYGCKYSTALGHGYALLRRPAVAAEIKRLQQLTAETIFLQEEDIVEKYMRAAFSSMDDFLEWGTEEVPVMTQFGPLTEVDEETGETVTVTKTANYVRFRPSDEVDGSLISEVKNGRDGASIKLLDKHKAMEWLSKYFVMFPESKFKLEYEKKKAEAELSHIENQEKEIVINIAPATQKPQEED